MSKIIFNFYGKEIIIQCNINEKMRDIFQRYSSNIQMDIDKVYFIYNEIMINQELQELQLKELINEIDKKLNITKIFVYENDKNIKYNNSSKEIIFPESKDKIIINNANYKMNLLKIINGHTSNNIILKNFEEKQNIEISKIICDNCQIKIKAYLFDNGLYKCLTCDKNLCPSCQSTHDKNHIITNYEKKSFICNEYNKLNIKDSQDNNQDKNFLEIEYKMNNINYIFGEIYIEANEINNNIRIINSFEQDKREYKRNERSDDYIYENEKEIIENCIIKINDKIIPFSYFYKFNQKGKYKIQYLFKNNLTKTNHMFFGCNSLINIDLSNFKTENVTNMSYMFFQCNSLTNINISNFKTYNVTNMSWMFYKCNSLINLNLSSFNTQNVIYMNYMFCDCNSLTNIDLSSFNTQNVINMNRMFSKCYSLTNLDLSIFNTQNITNMNSMFFGCKSLTNINISNFNTQNVIDMNNMFSNCYSLTSINLSNFNTQNVINMSYMFFACNLLTNLDLSNFNTQNVTNMSYMFFGCNSLTIIDLSNFNFKNVINMSFMFFACNSLTYINLSKFIIHNNTNMKDTFFSCHSLIKKIIKDKNMN